MENDPSGDPPTHPNWNIPSRFIFLIFDPFTKWKYGQHGVPWRRKQNNIVLDTGITRQLLGSVGWASIGRSFGDEVNFRIWNQKNADMVLLCYQETNCGRWFCVQVVKPKDSLIQMSTDMEVRIYHPMSFHFFLTNFKRLKSCNALQLNFKAFQTLID